MEVKEMKNKIIAFIVIILCALALCFALTRNNKEEIQTAENATNNVIITEETQELANTTIEDTLENKDLSTKEVIESTLEEEQELEPDATVEQENIAYNGDNTGNGLGLLGSYQGLTYYSQADPRWANTMYSSIGDRSQTMKSSACRTDKCSDSSKF